MNMLPEAYEEGRCAAFDGIGQDTNPYRPGTKEAEQWHEGWRDGMAELSADSDRTTSR
jgi:ribosome modulation factor